MIKKYLKLTKEQKERGVIFSSAFIINGKAPVRHEITRQEYIEDRTKADEKEARLKDDKFFRGWSYYSNGRVYHEIRK